ncbi:hypothetical protein X943_002131 [Babesia divergens]|uniref:Uncharacterized protein n=1 Tax=Babesia divergens TaxID=32595 RepID=A0AAD9G762_BABDI|nr:hypothetical protein X943_002131 [Babesia divergens]
MTTWREPDNENLPYRASIDDGVYQRCGDMYNSYFEDLESIGPLNTRDDASVSAKESGRKIKVGAKPLSGVRGIYYTRGTWRVQYRGNGQDIVSCVFNYDTKEVLIATFDLAFKLLRRVIKLGRHIKKEDGMIIGELTEDRLLDLDRRSRLRTSKQNGGCSKDSTPLSCKRVTRPRYDFDSDDNESEADYSHSPVCKKTRPSCEKISPQSCGVGSDIAVAPNMNYYVGKLSSFERRFQSYGNIATHALISFLIDEGCMRNSEIRGAGRRGDLYFSNEMGNDNLSEKGEPPSRDTYTIESPELYPPQVPRSTSLDGLDALYNQNTDSRYAFVISFTYIRSTARS